MMRMFRLSVVLVFALTVSSVAWGVRLSGTVTDNDGPVSGALVHSLGLVSDSAGRAGTETDARGRFVLVVEGRPSRLIVSHPGRVTTIVDLPQRQYEIDVRLEHGGYPLRGRVSDAEGNPVSDAQVAVTSIKRPGDRVAVSLHAEHVIDALRATSGHDGSFEIRCLPAWTELTAEARKTGLGTVVEELKTGPGVSETRSEVAIPEPPLQILMVPEATVSGRVTWRGAPVSGAEVSARRGDDWTRVTDSHGTFHIRRLPPGTVRLSVRPPDGLVQMSSVPEMRVGAGEIIRDVEIELVKPSFVTGTVTRTDTGEPVQGVSIGARYVRWQRTGRTDESGQYRLQILPGEVVLTLVAGPGINYAFDGSLGAPPGYDPRPTHAVSLREGEILEDIDFAVEPWLIGDIVFSGQVRLPDDAPAAGARVSVRLPTRSGMQRTEEPRNAVIAGNDGTFELRPVLRILEEFYLLEFTSADDSLIAARVIPARPLSDLDVRVNEPAYARLPVEWVDGTPRGPESVSLSAFMRFPREQMQSLEAAARDDGEALVLGPLPSAVPLIFRADLMAGGTRMWWGPMTLALRPGETVDLPRLAVSPPQAPQLTGRVLDRQEQPVEGARVFASPSLLSLDTVATGADGRFTIQPSGSGRGQLGLIAASGDGRLSRGLWLGDQAEGEHVLVLAEPGTLHGTLLSLDGSPATGVRVFARAGWSGLSISDVVSTQMSCESDAAGRWRFEGLIPGLTYSLSAHDSVTRTRASHSVGPIEPGDQGPVELQLEPLGG